MELARDFRWRRAALAVAAVLVVASPASAAAPWSEPQTLAGGHLDYWQPAELPGAPANSAFGLTEAPALLGFTPGGAGLAIVATDSGGRGIARFSGSSGTFGAVRASTFGGVLPSQMALYGREGVMVSGAATSGRDPVDKRSGTPLDAAVTRGTLSGGFQTRQVLAHGLVAGSPAAAIVVTLAVNAAGDAAAVVSAPVKGRTRVTGYQARLFIRRRGQSSFRRIIDLGPKTIGRSPAALAVNAPGDVLVSWDDRTSVRARLVTAAGRVGGAQRLGPGGSAWVDGSRMSAAIDASRRMLVAWVAQRVGEGGFAGRPGIVALAYASPYKSFRPAQVTQRNLPTGADNAIGLPGVVAGLLRDRGVVAFEGDVDGRRAVRTVDVRSGKAGTVHDLSPAGTVARLRGLAIGPRGGTVVSWWGSAGTAPPAGVFAVARAAGTTDWGPLETIGETAAPAGAPDPVNGALAADPVSGRAVMLWSDVPVPGPAATAPPPVPARYSVRASADG
jgi:hypothetical protein